MAAGRDRGRLAAVAAGGAAGAAVRWAVITSVPAGRFPWPVLLVNVAGSLLVGALLAEEWRHPRAHLLLHDFAGIGFCGGLTTFSTFAVEVVDLLADGHAWTAVLYGAASVATALAAVVAGASVLRMVRAVDLPLEEQL